LGFVIENGRGKNENERKTNAIKIKGQSISNFNYDMLLIASFA
jgi:hypothetical protein